MTTPSPALSPLIGTVLHPSDFSEASTVAFAHALKATLVAKGKLALLHITDDRPHEWADFPGVRETLERWKLLPAGSAREAVVDLGIDVAKVIGRGPNPVQGVLGYLEEHPVDLIVLATNHRGFDWLQQSTSEPLARKAGEMTLFVPAGGHGFVSLTDGSISLRNILIPIAATPRPEPAIAGAARLIQQLKCESGQITLLHVGDDEPSVTTPDVPGWTWQNARKQGNVIDVILETAREMSADLIVMSTDGRNGFLDMLRGSHSERVLRKSPCPLLAIPESSYISTVLQPENTAP